MQPLNFAHFPWFTRSMTSWLAVELNNEFWGSYTISMHAGGWWETRNQVTVALYYNTQIHSVHSMYTTSSSYHIAPNFWGNIILWSSWFDFWSRKFSSWKLLWVWLRSLITGASQAQLCICVHMSYKWKCELSETKYWIATDNGALVLRLASLLRTGLLKVRFAPFVIRWPSQCLTFSIYGRRHDGAFPEVLLSSWKNNKNRI